MMATLPVCCVRMLEWEAKHAERCAHEWRQWDGGMASGATLADEQSERIGRARELRGCLALHAGGSCARLNPPGVAPLTLSRIAG